MIRGFFRLIGLFIEVGDEASCTCGDFFFSNEYVAILL